MTADRRQQAVDTGFSVLARTAGNAPNAADWAALRAALRLAVRELEATPAAKPKPRPTRKPVPLTDPRFGTQTALEIT